MTKVAIKNENITSFGGVYHIMDVFSKLGFEKLIESVLDRRGSSGKAFSYGSSLGSLFFIIPAHSLNTNSLLHKKIRGRISHRPRIFCFIKEYYGVYCSI